MKGIQRLSLVGFCALGLLGCAHSDYDYERKAISSSKRIAAFETDCAKDEIESIVLSSGRAPIVRWYTVGTRGCGERRIYEVVCASKRCTIDHSSAVTLRTKTEKASGTAASAASAP